MGALALLSSVVYGMMFLQTLTHGITLKALYNTFPDCEEGWASPDFPVTSLIVSSPSTCAMSCLQTKTCLAYNICEHQDQRRECYLLPSIKLGRCSDLVPKDGCSYMEKQGNPCQNGGTWNPPNCACVDGYAGQYCERYIRSCKEGYDLGLRVSKYYMVQPFGSPVAYQLYCNLQWAATAHFFVRKRNPTCPTTGFDKTWNEYKEGWGDASCGDYFVGLETLHQLMKYEQFQIHVYGELINGMIINYFYAHFTILSESENYKMNYDNGFNRADNKGDDGLGSERPRDFCTQDRDCGACAVSMGGGWWYSSGCGGYPMTSSLVNFVWPVDGADMELDKMFFQLDHMAYLT